MNNYILIDTYLLFYLVIVFPLWPKDASETCPAGGCAEAALDLPPVVVGCWRRQHYMIKLYYYIVYHVMSCYSNTLY